MIKRSDDRIVECGTAARIDTIQGVLHFTDIVGEVVDCIQVKIIIKIDDEGLILRIAGFHESQGRGIYLGPLFAHAAAIVDHQAHAYGHVFLAENRDFLIDLVFQDVEIVLLQPWDELPAIVHDRDVQDNEIYVLLNGVIRPLQGSLGSRGLLGPLRVNKGSSNRQDRGRKNQRERR
jgi:hypothetical protein